MTEIFVDDEPITVVFRNDRLTLYPLPLKQLKKLRKDAANSIDDPSDARLESIIDQITFSAQIGDSTVTKERVEGLITAQNAARVMKALLGASGLSAKDEGDTSPPAMAPQNGAISTPTSSQPQDGDGQTLMS